MRSLYEHDGIGLTAREKAALRFAAEHTTTGTNAPLTIHREDGASVLQGTVDVSDSQRGARVWLGNSQAFAVFDAREVKL